MKSDRLSETFAFSLWKSRTHEKHMLKLWAHIGPQKALHAWKFTELQETKVGENVIQRLSWQWEKYECILGRSVKYPDVETVRTIIAERIGEGKG